MVTQNRMDALLGKDERRHKAFELMIGPPLFMDSGVRTMSQADRQFAADWLEKLGLRALLVSAYLEERGAKGCGDNGDEAAMAAANATVEKVKEILGYQPRRRKR